MKLGISAEFSLGFDELEDAVINTLQEHGFGILTEIDVQATMKKKLNINYPRYKILGACNPTRAHTVLKADSELGLLLPCNVIIYEKGTKNVVSFVDANTMFSLIKIPEIEHVANSVSNDFSEVIDKLKQNYE